ncbi:hypothetical protein [Jonesia quinghaiensis]|uniref:hypothetical protein n=1 Tax=Jonesia quinghaiensis TaxID=262806 RepID=UPI00048B8A15|nr:hypothetical protein [Jonesia quinghaiensis]
MAFAKAPLVVNSMIMVVCPLMGAALSAWLWGRWLPGASCGVVVGGVILAVRGYVAWRSRLPSEGEAGFSYR